MNQRGYLNIYVFIGVVLLTIIVGYFIIKEEAVSPAPIFSPTPSKNAFSKLAIPLEPSPASNKITAPAASVARDKSITELKYGLENSLGKAVYCGPPTIPSDYNKTLIAQFPVVTANTEEFSIILMRLGITKNSSITDQQKLAIVNEHNRLSVISLGAVNSDYRFVFRGGAENPTNRFIAEGVITSSGEITVTKKEPDTAGCPK